MDRILNSITISNSPTTEWEVEGQVQTDPLTPRRSRGVGRSVFGGSNPADSLATPEKPGDEGGIDHHEDPSRREYFPKSPAGLPPHRSDHRNCANQKMGHQSLELFAMLDDAGIERIGHTGKLSAHLQTVESPCGPLDTTYRLSGRRKLSRHLELLLVDVGSLSGVPNRLEKLTAGMVI